MHERMGSNTITNTIGMNFVIIPAGTFMMGSPDNDRTSYDDEKPQHQVTISGSFYMQTTEVTQGQWKTVMGNNPSRISNWFLIRDDYPVTNVSWEDVQKFIQKLNNMERMDKYRLPTEAEWEYAARAGTTTLLHTGNTAKDLSRIGWWAANSGSKIHRVGQKMPNAWGLYDMHGNVWEWVHDWHGNYPAGSVTDPVGPSSGSYRVRRGGSHFSSSEDCRSACRGTSGHFLSALSSSLDLYINGPGARNYLLGFRLLRTL